MLNGQYQHTLDAKGRLILPAKIREVLGPKFCLTKGFEHCLNIYPLEEWEQFEKRLDELPAFSKQARKLKRHFVGSYTELEPDKQGRFLIAQPLRDFAGIDKDVTVIGVSDHVEIWSTERYYAYEEDDTDGSIEDMAESLIF